jgi:hypothetical protein
MSETKKIRVPDGHGNWVEVPAGTKAKIDPQRVQETLQKKQEEDFFNRVGACTESLNKYLKAYARDYGLSPEEIIASVYLENCNNRYYFPEELGGKNKFDQITTDVWNWFKEQVVKEPT